MEKVPGGGKVVGPAHIPYETVHRTVLGTVPLFFRTKIRSQF